MPRPAHGCALGSRSWASLWTASCCRCRQSTSTRTERWRKVGKIWIEHSALEFVESVADDVKPGKHTSFPQSVKLETDEVVLFSCIVFKSRAQRDRVHAEVMADPRLADMMDPKALPFDGRRMFWGGFKQLVSLSAG